MIKPILCLLLIVSIAYAQSGPEPDPWWKQVENWQSLAMKWIAALTVIVGAMATLAGLVLQKLKQVREFVNDQAEATEKRLDRQTSAIQATQEQVVDIAKAVPPPPVVIVAPETKT